MSKRKKKGDDAALLEAQLNQLKQGEASSSSAALIMEMESAEISSESQIVYEEMLSDAGVGMKRRGRLQSTESSCVYNYHSSTGQLVPHTTSRKRPRLPKQPAKSSSSEPRQGDIVQHINSGRHACISGVLLCLHAQGGLTRPVFFSTEQPQPSTFSEVEYPADASIEGCLDTLYRYTKLFSSHHP